MDNQELAGLLELLDNSLAIEDGKARIRDRARLQSTIYRLAEVSALESGPLQGLARYVTRLAALAFGAYFALLRQIGPARSAYVGVMCPIVALLVSAALEGYDWTAATLAGIALAVAGNVVALQRSVNSHA